MKKKIILLAVALMLFAGVVSASSINGDYQGMPIVKITSGDRVLETDEVPGFIYEGHTVVPISTLRQLGASVTWDAYGYSVDVKLPNQQQPTANPQPAQSNSTTPDIDAIVKKLGYEGEKLIYHAQYFSIGEGTGQLSFKLTFDADDPTKGDAMNTIFDIAVQSGVMQLKYEDTKYETFMFINDLADFRNGKLSVEEFSNKMTVRKIAPSTNAPSTPTPLPTPDPVSVPAVNSNVIESEIDGNFKGWTGETIFKLTNGQIWEQAEFGFHYHYAYNPEVTIYKDGSSYIMLVDGVDEKLKVKRMK